MMRVTLVILLALLVLQLGKPVQAQIRLADWVVASAGGTMSSANHQLAGTLGQTAVGPAAGGDHRCDPGFWLEFFYLATDVADPGGAVPSAYALSLVSGNPARDVALLRYAVPRASHVTIRLYDVTGRQLQVLCDAEQSPGHHDLALPSAGLPAGVYFCRMTADSFAQTQRLMLLR
jgi:hypothetical protein